MKSSLCQRTEPEVHALIQKNMHSIQGYYTFKKPPTLQCLKHNILVSSRKRHNKAVQINTEVFQSQPTLVKIIMVNLVPSDLEETS